MASSLEELPDAYAQARRAVEVGRRVSGGGSTTFFDQLGLHRLIALIPDADELRSFVQDVLGPLAEQTTEAADLRETLQEVRRAASSLRTLSDYIERHPEALLRGKKEEKQ